MKCRFDDGPLPCGPSCSIKRTIYEDGKVLTTTAHGTGCREKA